MAVEPHPLGPDEQLLFVHIRKTAGTSLIRLLDQHFVEDELCPVDWPYRQEIHEIQGDEFQRASFIRGHFVYDEVVKRVMRPLRVMTMLRDPVERFVSEFEHIRRIVLDEVPRAWVPDFARPYVLDRERRWKYKYREVAEQRLGLAEFVEMPHLYRQIANAHVRMLSAHGDIGEAKQRLDAFEFVGIAEEFARSVELLCYLLGLPEPLRIEWYNRAPKRRKRGRRWMLSRELKSRVEKIETLDLELYEYARERFERDYATMRRKKQQKQFYIHFARAVGGVFSEQETHGWWFGLRRVPVGYGWSKGILDPKFGILRPVSERRKVSWLVAVSTRATQLMMGFVIIGDPSQLIWHFGVNGRTVPARWMKTGPQEYVVTMPLLTTQKGETCQQPWAIISLCWRQRATWKIWIKQSIDQLAHRLLYHPRCQGRCQRWVRRMLQWARQGKPAVRCQWIATHPDCEQFGEK